MEVEFCYLETRITTYVRFVSFSKDDISKPFMMLSNTQLHSLTSNREKLYEEVKRKDREASDFQVKVSGMKQQ